MMKYPLNSKFSDRITDFVDYKHSLGHSYEESCRILWKFDLFCCDRFPEKSSFDRDIAMAWLEMRDTEGRAGHRNRIMVLREFARYLSAIGDTAYLIPISMTAKAPDICHTFLQLQKLQRFSMVQIISFLIRMHRPDIL